ncbi:MAG: class I SAM-dependent methyltransferase [Gammaproteobacteria bacterium]|nr:class I SAM-dependent methyltransferase [Gammaproteobacteria bacterium]
MSIKHEQKKWNNRYAAAEGKPRVAQVLRENSHLLPASGDALDLACGLGANALLLAQAGLAVQAWDLSSVAIDALRSHAVAECLPVQAAVRNVDEQPPIPASFDVIVVSYFLQRALAPALCAALRPGGLLFYQTFVKDKVSQKGPTNPDFLLAENELLTMFAPLRLRVYHEAGALGDITQGLRNEALYIGQKAEGR